MATVMVVAALAVPASALPNEGAGGATLVGTIRDDVNSAPIDGASVCLHDVDGGTCHQTDSSGGFTFADVLAGNYELWVTPPAGSDYLPVGGNPGTYAPVPAVPVNLVDGTQSQDVRLMFGGRIGFSVTGATGQPAAGEPFAVCQTDDPGAVYACPMILPLGSTDANGLLTTMPIPAGEYRATVGAANGPNGYPVTVTGIVVDPQTTVTESVQLEAAGSLNGVVRDSTNTPVVGALVSIGIPPNVGTSSAPTDAAGAYSFPSLAPGTYYGTVYAPTGGLNANLAIGPITVTAGGAATASFTLAPASRITGTSATDGAVVADLGAVLICPGSATPNVTAPVTCSDGSPGQFAALSGPVGTTPVPFTWIAPSAGVYTIRAGYYAGALPFYTGVAGSPSETVTLAAGETVSCTFVAGAVGSASCGGPPPPPPGLMTITVAEPPGSATYAFAICRAPGMPSATGSCSTGGSAQLIFNVAGGGTTSRGLDAGTYNMVMAAGFTVLSPIGSVTILPGGTTACTSTMAAGPVCTVTPPDDGDGVIEPPAGFPPSYDGNGDGIADAEQANVTSLLSAVGAAPVTIAAPAGTTLTDVTADPVPLSPPPPGAGTFPVGLLGFSVHLANGDSTADVEIHLPAGTNPNAYYKLVGGAWVAAPATIAGDVVTLHLVDNDAFDTDPTLGVIGDPGGPAIVDLVAPTVTGSASGLLGDNGWFRGPVTITWTTSDAAPSSGLASTPGPSLVGSEGTNTYVSDDAVDNAGNRGHGALSVKIDSIPPSVTCPSDVHFAQNQSGATVTATVADGTSGPVAASVSAPVGTAVAGAGSVSLTGRDLAGNETTVSCGYVVDAPAGYSFQGFGWPVDNGRINVVKSGQQVPLSWRITGPTGAGHPGPSTFGGITSATVTCPAWPSDRVELTLPFAITPTHVGAGFWLGTWKAPKAVPGKCVEMRLTLGDGSVHTAVFRVVA